MSQVVWNQIVTQAIPLLNGRPEDLRRGIPVKTNRIAQSACKDLVPRAVGIVAVDCRASRVFAHLRILLRSDPNVEFCSRLVKQQAARPVPRIHSFEGNDLDRKSTRLNSSHLVISYAVFC